MRKNLLLLGTCLTLLLAGCSSPAKDIAETVKNVTNNSDPTPTPEPTGTPAPKETKLALGKKGSIGDWDIRVKKAEIRTKIKNGKYIALDKVESICLALDVTPNDILEFIQSGDKGNA